jgi:hypothetical protein
MARIELTISGLCLFVPDRSTSPTRTVVLLPNTPIGGAAVHDADVVHNNRPYPLGMHHQLEFPDVPQTDAALLAFPPGIVDLARTCRVSVDRDDLSTSPKHIKGRVLLTAGGIQSTGQTLHWTLCGAGGVVMTDEVRWSIDGLTSSQLTVRVSDFAGAKVEDLPLQPDADDVLKLRLDHHSHDSVVGHPPCPHLADHFVAYFSMLNDGDGKPVPELEDCHIQVPQGFPVDSAIPWSPTVFTCMVAGATP